MSKKIAIVYSSVDGQTKKICEKLNSIFEKEQIQTELCSIDTFNSNVLQYHTLIIGASIRYGKHNTKVSEFILNNMDKLNEIQTAFFSVNLVARKEDKNSSSTNPYMIKFLEEIEWKADFLEVFAGKLDYNSYSFLDRIMIKLIMWITKGPTKSKEPIEYTKWKKVSDFGLKIIENYNSTNQNSVHK
ncbi:menaquinone-dependent protoporphyrinogen IX dehydrogenase [Aquimarina litoralis]|uniref:menaquinone-dependent protoporphyrinogen IX dehydrogenase n=1 Tax=Aquimarina litoralis TaxID=584605 RepID=UPI001C589AF2|nr:menaquinone-dependent protoporphyrinogen IX dehydrogenase [Aquimarina litoralis]MBW1294817.1 menaquinone-dependent protoporphyrinogen IX dehydrogenase [Aquimarina litoralis]